MKHFTQRLITLVLLTVLFAAGTVFAADGDGLFLKLWPENKPFPNQKETVFPEGLRHYIVQDCDLDPDYKFLHETTVGFNGNELVAGWYNNPKLELSGKTFQRARRSKDDGKTWSDIEIVRDEGNDKGRMYVGIQFFDLDGKFYAFTNEEKGAEKPVNMLLLVNDKETHWQELGPVAPRFLSMQPPILMDDGNYVMSGSYNPKPGDTFGYLPVVYISQGKDITKPWRRYLIDTEFINIFAETAVVPDGPNMLAVTRLENSAYPNFYASGDFGRTWSKVENKTFLACNSKFAGGKLSNGVRYILFNLPAFERDASGKIIEKSINKSRTTLAIATARPGDRSFTEIWKISDPTTSTNQKMSHYPCAVERNGNLYITYTGQHKLRNCGLTIVPIASLLKESR